MTIYLIPGIVNQQSYMNHGSNLEVFVQGTNNQLYHSLCCKNSRGNTTIFCAQKYPGTEGVEIV